MIIPSITSAYFLAVLLLGPILTYMRGKVRPFFFLAVNISLYMLTFTNMKDLFISAVFIVLPFFLMVSLLKKDFTVWPLILIMICSYVYLNGYSWILVPLLGNTHESHLKILGLSYIFFRQLDLLMHVQARIIDRIAFVDYLNYIFSFYTILAGPIQRYRDFVEAYYKAPSVINSNEDMRHLHRISNGLLKVLLLGVLFRNISDGAYRGILLNGPSFQKTMIMFYSYPLYVYFNFSGYCDVVIGMARWAGLNLPENFDKPYLSRNMIEFWNRWHITLSQWLRDYIYQPLLKFMIAGFFSKKIKTAQYISIFITFLVAGLWHGTTLNFLVFGVLHGIGMAISMMYRDGLQKAFGKEWYKQYSNKRIVAGIERAICMHFVCFTFMFFEYDMKNIVGIFVHLV